MGDNLFAKSGKFLKGYVTVLVEGIFLEKFTNLCAVNCLPFWCVKRYGMTKMVGRTTVLGYKRMRHIARKCGCRLRICKRRGVPFFLHRYRKRKVFIVGAVLFFVLIKVNSFFVWDVEVVGNEGDISDEIVSQVRELGVKPGVLKSKVDVNDLSRKLMVKRDDLSWAGIEIDGMKLRVKVVEKNKVPERIDESMVCDIVASKPGLITGINTLQGTQVAQIGSIVDTGDVLVSGVVTMEQFPDKTQFVHSLAKIEARVWYERAKTLRLSERWSNEEIQGFAYSIAYDKVMREVPKGVKVSNVSRDVRFDGDKVTVSVIVETLEDIGVKQVIDISGFN